MKGRLALINLALAALVALGGWQLREKWQQARAREAALYRQQVKPAPAPLLAPIPAAEPVTAMTYGEVAQKMLFSRDRNPTVEIEVETPKPMPPLPVAYGVMAFGDVRTAILSPRAGQGHRAFSPGEQVGEFKLVSVDPEQLVFEWDGQTIVKRVEDLMSKERGQPPPGATESAAAAPPPPPVTTSMVAAAPARSGPGAEVAPGMRACQPGDTAPAGTVVDGLRKVVTKTPFSEVCRWEPVR